MIIKMPNFLPKYLILPIELYQLLKHVSYGTGFYHKAGISHKGAFIDNYSMIHCHLKGMKLLHHCIGKSQKFSWKEVLGVCSLKSLNTSGLITLTKILVFSWDNLWKFFALPASFGKDMSGVIILNKTIL